MEKSALVIRHHIQANLWIPAFAGMTELQKPALTLRGRAYFRHPHCFSHAPLTIFGYSGLPKLPL